MFGSAITLFSSTKHYRKNLPRILFATDFGAAAGRARQYLEELSVLNAEIVILHVGKRAADPDSEARRSQVAEEELNALSRQISASTPGPDVHDTVGDPPRKILQEAHKRHIDLILLGRFNDSPLRKLVGSTAEEVADKAQCSILLVP